MNIRKQTNLAAIFREFLTRYPRHFSAMFIAQLMAGVASVFSVIAIVPLGDFILDSSLQSPSPITGYVIIILKYLGVVTPGYWIFGFLFVGFNGVKGLLDVLVRYTILRIKYAIQRGLAVETLSAIFKARWGFFSGASQGQLLNTFSKELGNIGDTLGQMATLLANIIQFALYLIIPMMVDSYLTFTMLGLALLFGSPFLLLQKVSYRLGQLNTTTSNNLLGVMSEIISAAKLILGFGKQKKALSQFKIAFNNMVGVTLKSQTLGIMVPSLFLPLGMVAAVISFGLALEQGTYTSELVAIFWSLLMALPILSALMQGNISIKNFLPSYEQLESLRKQAIGLIEIEGTKVFQQLSQGIELNNIDFTYPGRDRTLRGVQISIEKEKMTALVGESGSGKSTIIDLVMGLQIPQKGDVLLDGVALGLWKQNTFRNRIGYVPQDPFLFNGSIKENLLWAKEEATDEELWEVCRFSYAEEFINQLPEGIDTIVGDRGVRLSGGQRQRIALARALVRKPELLILDEATSALDTDSERFIQKSINNLAGHMTILVIAHRLSTIVKAEMIYVLKDGSVVEQGSYIELMQRKERFFQLAQDQSH
jgi:ABC-type multidrug transport system fused ATPase/permease subunit